MILRLLKKLRTPEHHEDGRERTALEKKLKHVIAKRKARKLHRDIMTGTAPRGRT